MAGDIDQSYGGLVEGVHLAGYSLERAFRKLEWLLDEGRFKTVGDGFEDVNAFLDTVKLDQFKIIANERKKIANRIKELQPEASNKQIAKVIGVNPSTIDEDVAAGNPASTSKKPNKIKAAKAPSAGNPARSLSGAAAAEAVAEKEAKVVRGTAGTGENEWYTPAEIIQAVRGVLGGIDLDPASSEQAQKTVQALRYFTLKDDGLEQDWRGTVWLNPPYAQPFIENFADKMIAEIKALHVTSAIMLTHNYTDTAWFHKLAAGADAICFTKGRIRFEAPDGTLAAPTQGQAFFYFGNQTARFLQVFTTIGFVMGALII
jgi:phage N-6-adenine-methyltransferase